MQPPHPAENTPITKVPTADFPCARCGYDLNTLPIDRVCPECGESIEATWIQRRRPLGSVTRTRRIATGWRLFALAQAASIGGAVVMVAGVLVQGPSPDTLLAQIALRIGPWLPTLAVLLGVWWITSPVDAYGHRPRHSILAARIGTLTWATLWVWIDAGAMFHSPTALRLSTIILAMAEAAAAVGLAALWRNASFQAHAVAAISVARMARHGVALSPLPYVGFMGLLLAGPRSGLREIAVVLTAVIWVATTVFQSVAAIEMHAAIRDRLDAYDEQLGS